MKIILQVSTTATLTEKKKEFLQEEVVSTMNKTWSCGFRVPDKSV